MSDKLKVEIVRTALAIAIALVLLVFLIYFVSDDPMEALNQLFLGPLTSKRGFGNIIEEWIPLVFTGLAVSLIFSSNNFNLASEGAFFVGGLLAMVLSLTMNISPIVFWVVLFVLTVLSGAVTAGVPGYLKNKFDASEIVSSIMLISIVQFFGSYVLMYYFKDPDARAQASLPFPEQYKLPVLIKGTNVTVGLFFALIAILVIYVLYTHTKMGYKIRLTGGNENFAKVLGVNTNITILSTQLIGGALACFGGAVYTLSMFDYYTDMSYNYGWDGIIVATLARNNPKYVAPAALFLAYLRAGAKIMTRRSDVPSEVIKIVQAIIILLIVAHGLLAKYEYKLLLKRIELEEKGGVA